MDIEAHEQVCAQEAGRGSNWLRRAKVRLGILLWALGVPIPIILIILAVRGC